MLKILPHQYTCWSYGFAIRTRRSSDAWVHLRSKQPAFLGRPKILKLDDYMNEPVTDNQFRLLRDTERHVGIIEMTTATFFLLLFHVVGQLCLSALWSLLVHSLPCQALGFASEAGCDGAIKLIKHHGPVIRSIRIISMPWILNVVKWMNILMSKWIPRERLTTCSNSKGLRVTEKLRPSSI